MDIAKVKTCPEREKYVCVLMDEMHIKADLVYDKHTGKVHCYNVILIKFYSRNHNAGAMIGFTNIGEVNSSLAKLERSLEGEQEENEFADHMLVLMVRGLFSNLQFPYVQFPCTNLSGEQLYHPFWTAVGRLERCGFRVMAITCDGLSAKRRLFLLHHQTKSPDTNHWVLNPYSDDGRKMFFISDPPHLIKTVRNAWANSKRKLWVSP